MKRFVILGCLTLALAGCAEPISCEAVYRLKEGVDTLKDAQALLDAPEQTMASPEGGTIYIWKTSTHERTGGGTITEVVLTFGRDGKLLAKRCTTIVQPRVSREPSA